MADTSTVVDSVLLATFTFSPIKVRPALVKTILSKKLNFWRFGGRRGGQLAYPIK